MYLIQDKKIAYRLVVSFFMLLTGVGYFLFGWYDMSREREVMKNPYVTKATIAAIIIDGKESEYKAEYYYNGELYVRNVVGTSIGLSDNQVVNIALLKDNPQKFIILPQHDHKKKMIISACVVALGVIMLIFEKRVIAFWKRIDPD